MQSLKQNVNISQVMHAIHAPIGKILCITSGHIVSKYEVNRTVTFWDIVKKQKSASWKTILGGVTSSGKIEIPAFVIKTMPSEQGAL